MTDGDNTQQAQRNGQVYAVIGTNLAPVSGCEAEPDEAHCIHLLTVTDGTTSKQASATVIEPARWYLRSAADRDTHRGQLFDDGMVMAECGLIFKPRTLVYGAKALPGEPPDPGQVCPRCRRGEGGAR
jgi:hypothetical protein